jgi:ATP-binding cassette subfamily C protein
MLALLAAAALSVVLVSSNIAGSLPVVALLGVAALRLMPAATRILGAIATIRFYRPALDQVARDLALLEGHSHAAHLLPAATPFRSMTPSIELRGLRYSYPGRDTPALNGVSCVIPGGTVCGLVGPSGAGKSTIADLMLGLLAPQEGAVLAEGVDLAEATAQWRKRVGYVPQTIYLLDDSVRRNVAFGIPDEEIDDARVWSALRASHMEAAARSLPHGLDERLGERGARLSGGQRQRIGIARALYAEPAMLVLDEATSALDLQTENAVAEAVLSLKGTRSVVVIAHRLETIRRCDLLFFLADGELQDRGRFSELLERNARFAAFVGHAGVATH